jgi:hypothetical protein
MLKPGKRYYGRLGTMPRKAKPDTSGDVWSFDDVVRDPDKEAIGTSGVNPEQEPDGMAPEPDGMAQGQVYLRSILMALLSDPGAPPAAKASATRTLAEMDGLIGRFQQAPDRASAVSVASLSRAELVRELARVRRLSGTKSA